MGNEAVHTSPIADPALLAKALENEQLRRAGTHVYHPQYGVIETKRARAHVVSGKHQESEFLGDPETGEWESDPTDVEIEDAERRLAAMKAKAKPAPPTAPATAPAKI